ncbi:MAG TPA: NAD+ synthase [Gammaproteobacteria bacterium]|jgi:NAD+ synthase (glutamine-hydrolysing)|nr:NAD+ synthase [Gammaproteobacteria bacterium]
MSASLRIVMAQLDLPVGDVAGNLQRILDACAEGRDRLKAQLMVFPELAVTGYPPEDLLFNSDFRRQVEEGVARLAAGIHGIHALVGYPLYADGCIYNVGAMLGEGKVKAVYRKSELPNYEVFDEKRYFSAGDTTAVVDVAGFAVGLNVCEDVWHAEPARRAAQAGAKLLMVPNASPFNAGKQLEREEELRRRVAEAGVPIVYVNHACGQDDLVFDGGSLVMNADGKVAARAPNFETGLYPVDFILDGGKARALQAQVHVDSCDEECIYKALVLGLKDYARKNRFKGALLGLSGGIDSALTLAIAVDALGAQNVMAVMLPSRYTSDLSLEGAAEQARKLGVVYHMIPIEAAVETLQGALQAVLPDTAGVTVQNLQARARGVMLMAISNRTGKLLLCTSNKSEAAMGYATLYGDMAGGFAPLSDVLKTQVYALSRYRNSLGAAIPEAVIQREPTAELAPGQKDSDTLPPYGVLDPILTLLLEEKSIEAVVAKGFDAATVRRVAAAVQAAEYKRRQAAPGVRVSRHSFGNDRRYPITSGFKRD